MTWLIENPFWMALATLLLWGIAGGCAALVWRWGRDVYWLRRLRRDQHTMLPSGVLHCLIGPNKMPCVVAVVDGDTTREVRGWVDRRGPHDHPYFVANDGIVANGRMSHWRPLTDEEFETASDIVHAINTFCFETIGLSDVTKDQITLLAPLSLSEMLAAVAIVVARNDEPVTDGATRRIHMVPDDRLTAAVYTLLHHKLRPHDEEDDIIAKFSEPMLGNQKRVHCLVVCQRELSVEDEPEEADAA